MAHRSLLEFRCDACGDSVHVDVTDGQEITDDWPLGWILTKAQIIGVEEEEEKVFCDKHSSALVKAFGYNSLSTMRAALEATADAKAAERDRQRTRQLRSEHGDIIMTPDGGILLIDDEEDD